MSFQLKNLPLTLPKQKGGIEINYVYYRDYKGRTLDRLSRIPLIRSLYERSKGPGWDGVCDYSFSKGNRLMVITIRTPSLKSLRKIYWPFSEMQYLATGFHEEAHAAEFSGNFMLIHALAEKTLGKSLPGDAIKWWDCWWRPNKEQLGYNASKMEHLIENWARVMEIVGLLCAGYSRDHIESFVYSFRDNFSPDVSDDFFFEDPETRWEREGYPSPDRESYVERKKRNLREWLEKLRYPDRPF